MTNGERTWKQYGGWIAAGLMVMGLMLASELVYAWRNKPTYYVNWRSFWHLSRMVKAAHRSEFEQALQQLGQATEYKLVIVQREYQDEEWGKWVDLSTAYGASHELETVWLTYMAGIDVAELSSAHPAFLAWPYYRMGLSAYEVGREDLAELFLVEAIGLAPEFSYLHVELANLYWLRGEFEKARETLTRCAGFRYPTDHCREFLDGMESGETPEVVGFQADDVERNLSL